MKPTSADSVDIAPALASWRQGDACLDAAHMIFMHLVLPESEGEPDVMATSVAGVVVTSQTCDVVRDWKERPYVEVCPLIPVEATVYAEVEAGRRPAYAALPGFLDQLLVADLGRSMTVDKSLLATWSRTVGWTNDEQIRRFAEALARRRSRFAFPDDFVYEYVSEFHSRILKKHNRASDEGKFLQSLREIRVRAAPSWNSPKVDIEWFFIRNEEPKDLIDVGKGWPDWVGEWLNLLGKHRKYRTSYHIVCRLEDITARDYVESDRLEFDRLS